MIKEYTVKIVMYGSISLASLFTVSAPVENFKNYLGNKYLETKNSIIFSIAKSGGYTQKIDPLSAELYAEREAIRYGINPSLIRALTKRESQNNSFAISPAHAIGYMQIHHTNTKRCGLSNPNELFDYQKNITCGLKILKSDLDRYKGNPYLAIQSWNGGPQCVNKCPESIALAQNVLSDMTKDIR